MDKLIQSDIIKEIKDAAWAAKLAGFFMLIMFLFFVFLLITFLIGRATISV